MDCDFAMQWAWISVIYIMEFRVLVYLMVWMMILMFIDDFAKKWAWIVYRFRPTIIKEGMGFFLLNWLGNLVSRY